MSNNALLKKRYGNVVEGPQGLQMPEKIARVIEAAAKSLPKNDEHFNYRRRAFSAKQEDVDGGARTEVSTITTDAVDRDGECVLTPGGDWREYNKIVPFCHDYSQLPAGINLWISPKGRATKAKTQYPAKPTDWGDVAWMPSAIWAFINQPVPTLGDKSIGFLPLNVRGATPQEKAMRPELASVPIIDKWLGLEYSCVLIPCNQEAKFDEVISKGLSDGTITKDFADFVHRAMEGQTKTVVSMTQGKTMDTPATGATEGDNATGGAVTPPTTPSLKSMKSNAHFKMPPHIQAGMKAMMDQIDPDDMKGDKPDEHALMMHSDMDTDDPAMVGKAIEGMGPMNCRMGKCKCMKTKDMDGGDVDTLSMGVSGKDLMPMHKALTAMPHSSANAMDFKPMVKLCDLKPGMSAKYKDMDDMSGMSMKLKTMHFKDSKGNTTALPLTGHGESGAGGDMMKAFSKEKTAFVQEIATSANEPEMKVFCPSCLEEAKKVGNVMVSGLGECEKFVCDSCGTEFMTPLPSPRSADTHGANDGTNQPNVTDITYGKGATGQTHVTASAAVVKPFITPEDLQKAIARRKEVAMKELSAKMTPVIQEELHRRLGII